MNFEDINNRIKNPIESKDTMLFLIDKYMESLNGKNFYELLLNNTEKKSEPSFKSYDEFYVMMFNEWKNNIIGMSFKQFSSLVENEKYKKNFAQMREFLEKLPEIKKKDEIDDLIYNKYKNKTPEIDEMLKAYYWIKKEELKDEIVFENFVKMKHVSKEYFENIFILDVKNEHVYEFAKIFVEKCIDYNVPYFFKFQKSKETIANFIICSSSNQIVFYLKIFEEIKRLRPEIVSKFGAAPILSGKLSSWLGFGTNYINPVRMDFYSRRIGALMAGFELYEKNFAKRVVSNQEIINEIAEKMISFMQEHCKAKVMKMFEPEDIKEVCIDSIPDFLNDFANSNLQSFDIEDEDSGDKISIDRDSLEKILKNYLLSYCKNDEKELIILIKCIKSVSEKYQISSKKICFDEK